ncbi:MAG: diguanylate cyclase [Planctomycetota bacterium]
MKRLADGVTGVVAVVGVLSLAQLAGGGDLSLVLAAVACSVFVFYYAASHGPWPGGLLGLLAGAGLVLTESGGLGKPNVLMLAACAGLAGSGFLFGRTLERRRLAAEEGERSAVELRRELYRLKRAQQDGARERSAAREAVAAPAVPSSGGRDGERLRAAVDRIATSLLEPRVIESTLAGICELLEVDRAVFHPHDRGANRFLPGRQLHGELAGADVGSNDPLLQLTHRRRVPLARGSGDKEVDQTFGVADPDISLAAPVFDRAMLTGVLLTSSPASERRNSSDLLNILAAACGLALSGARLWVRCEEQSKYDPLTGLVDLDTIRSVLEESLVRGPAAVLLVAADGVRRVNESYGRRAGDRVISSMARLVSMEVGVDGRVGRYGGATLLVVLPGHRIEAASELAGQLKRRVPMSICAGPEGLAGPLSISVGVAAASAGSVDMLTNTAEQALAVEQKARRAEGQYAQH